LRNLSRRNHFLPVCYQEGFTDASGKVWVKFENKTQPEHRSPATVGRRRSLYIREQNGTEDDNFETFFNQNVEDPFSLLSQRIRTEREKVSAISTAELTILAKFVASQAVRTLAHKMCIEEQAKGPVVNNVFLEVMNRKMFTILEWWVKNLPSFHFFTSLPHVGEHFISGDNPVVLLAIKNDPIWMPPSPPETSITDLVQLLKHPNYGFWVSLSPYICFCIQSNGSGESRLPPEVMEPQKVRLFNKLVRNQSKIFTLARDKESLVSGNRK
jgi:uncharacterized protein DUF4238